MEQKLIKKVLKIDGMTCTSCEMRIQNNLKKLKGILEVHAKFSNSTVNVTFDENLIKLDKIISSIEKLDYKVKNNSVTQNDKLSINMILGIGIILVALYLIIQNTVGFNFIPTVTPNMGFGILFVVGLITSLHCIAMCGGINLSQCVSYKLRSDDSNKMSKLKPSFMYNAGRVISYTIVGGIVGALGSAVSFSGTAKGIIAIASGVFMIIMGVNMLNIFPWLRRFNPRMPKFFGNKIHKDGNKHGPFYVGLLNGLMPCGPLQAMQIYALGTGSLLMGAASMFFFSLGTVPLMFGFGAISSFLSSKFTKNMMKVSATLVIVLGVIMFNRGLGLSGVDFAVSAAPVSSSNVAKIEGNVQVVTTQLESGKYPPIIVQKGIPVRWDMKANAKDINGCNGTIDIAKFSLEKKLQAGDNFIEFTPDQTGNIPYSCSMGMITSNIKVVDDITKVTGNDVSAQSSSAIASSNSQSGALGGTGGGASVGSSGSSGASSGGCCAAGAQATKFAGGKIPTDNI